MSAAQTWALIGGCAAVTAAIKAVGPVAFGGRDLPAWFASIVTLLAPALLAALVATAALSDDGRLRVGADTAGVALAGVFLLRGASVITGVAIAAATTAALRAF